ncbi:TIGR04283 family arsenosugar biosynthesis glycosyltransferase [Sulfurospirillum multivorans]|uniref:Glycosyltransferase n=2 Tax=Sulfurospirillum multivorans TaxID=66821 RepID=A0AA86ALV9_SULMK|nr:TIGR04283 family arsenosugar biosynthesis glycosyltransferase [Sulfurospirillum multivorans]AHJ12167.1 putative glycosyltransferase [Sulfurospirillum multivorans DSM 12446]QEH05667.1 putative glycosyltransferase [Sulfurospirillum multivorans]
MRQNALIFFMKAPVIGRVKTRLAEGIGNDNATTLYRLMCAHLLSLAVPQNTDVIVAYDDEERMSLPDYLEGTSLFYQSGNDLGERMQNAFEAVFAKGYKRAILVGSDIPNVDGRILEEAFAHLCNNDAMLSPTEDGGYYLIGFHAHTFCKEAFEGIRYSQSDVYANTLLKLSPLRVTKGEMLRDIDTLEDLRAFTCKEKLSPLGTFAQNILNDLPRISVIIPAYHEDETLLHTLSHLKAMAHAQNYEIIVVDTHEKTTVERLRISAVRVAFSSKGRSTQMNEGARKARGEMLLFLHADTLLPYHWDTKIENALHVNKAGAFNLGINDSHLGLFFIETMANLRTKMTKIPYGDQAHFFQTSFFRALGGYAQIALMEDVEIMKRLKKRGQKITLLKSTVLTSPRRWHKEGILYVTLRNRTLSFLYWLGVSPQQLIKHYKAHRN